MSELSWLDVERLIGKMAQDIRGRIARGTPTPDRVIGVARGGWVPAVLLAGALDVRCLQSVQVSLYDGRERRDQPRLEWPVPATAGPSGNPAATWVVDEMADSGRTLRALRTVYPAAHLAVLVCRPQAPGARELDLVAGCEVACSSWVLFPWSPPEDRQPATDPA